MQEHDKYKVYPNLNMQETLFSIIISNSNFKVSSLSNKIGFAFIASIRIKACFALLSDLDSSLKHQLILLLLP